VPAEDVPVFEDHCLFLGKSDAPISFPERFCALGIVSMLEGSGKFTVNGSNITLNETGFLVVNRGSTLSFSLPRAGAHVTLLYFNTILSDLVLEKFFFSEYRSKTAEVNIDDFSLIEHVHYENASLKQYLPLLIELGNSCASFNALKADMVIRSMLEYIISENHEAIQVSSKLKVVKRSTRVDLYKRLTMTKNWIDLNYGQPVKLDHLAGISMLNAEHFLRLFKQAYGKTPRHYLTEVRIERAKHLLHHTDMAISQVCNEIGFESISSFSLLFRQYTGSSPGRFRKAVQ